MRTLLAIALVGTATTSHARDNVPAEERGAVEGQSSARADNPVQIVVEVPEGDVAFEAMRAEVREAGDTALVNLSLVMASRRDNATGRIVLRVPSNARIVGMSYSQGGAQVVASSQPNDEARLKFEATEHGVVDWRTLGRPMEVRTPAVRDPALLEWTSTDIDRNNYRLSVFPMSSFERTTAVVSIAMPRFRQLVIAPASHVKPIVHVGRLVLDAGALPAPTDADVALAGRPSAVEPSTSLYAAPAVLPVAHPALHAVILNTSSQLRDCFKADRLWRPHDVVVNFSISDHGQVDPKVTGGSQQLNTCIAKVARTWRFRPSLATKGAIDYPLHYTP